MKEKIIPKKDTTGKDSDKINREVVIRKNSFFFDGEEEKPPYSRSVNGWLDDVEKVYDFDYENCLFKLC